MKDEYTLGRDDFVTLDDVEIGAINYRDRRTAESRAQRDRLIATCYRDGDVTWEEVARAADLTPGRIRQIVTRFEVVEQAAAEPRTPAWPTADLHIVR
jgi:hypothetical protein